MSKDVNSVGGSERHQLLLNHFHHRLSGGLVVRDNCVSHPDLDVVVATIMTIAAPHNDADIRALSKTNNGVADGVTDGKVLLIDQDVMVDRILNSDYDSWFNQVMRDVLAASRDQETVCVKSISITDMDHVLGDRLNPVSWRSEMGYDDARRHRYPAMEALEGKNSSRDYGQGDFNRSAGLVFHAYLAAMTAQKIRNVESRDRFLKKGAVALEKFALHGEGIQSFFLTWLAAKAFGVNEESVNIKEACPWVKEEVKVFRWPATEEEKIQVFQSFTIKRLSSDVFEQMLDVISGCNSFFPFGQEKLLGDLVPKSRSPKL